MLNTYLFYLSLFFVVYLLLDFKWRTIDRKFTFGNRPWSLINKTTYDVSYIMISILPLIIIMGIRSNVGTDYQNYSIMYRDYVLWNYANYEIGIELLFKISKALDINYQGFLFLTAILCMFVSILAIRKHCEAKLFPIAVFLFFCMYFGPACNIMAQVIALAFLILAYEQILKKNFKKFLLWCFIASCFHSASIIIVLLYIIYNAEEQKYVSFASICIIFVSVIFAVFPSLLEDLLAVFGVYSRYFSYKRINTFIYFLIYRLPIYVLELLYYRQVISKSKDSKLYYFLVILEIASCILGIGIAWLGRFMYYFSVAHVFLGTQMIKMSKKTIDKNLMIVMIMSYYLIVFFMVHFFSEFDGISHYSHIFS